MSQFSFGNFRWFLGEVVDIDDKEMLGRVKVKIFGKHTIENEITKEQLPWAIVATSPSSASTLQVGEMPHGLVVGSQVVGFFTDGEAEQVPMVLFSYPAKTDNEPDLSKLAREENDIENDLVGYEPKSPYNAKYPHNRVIKTKTGHVIEIDDTKGHERLHIMHRSGSFYQFYPNGDCVRKSYKDDYEIIVGNQYIWVGGNVKEHICGNYDLEVEGNYNINVNGNYNVKVDGRTSINTQGTFSNRTNSNAIYSSSSTSKHTASVIMLN